MQASNVAVIHNNEHQQRLEVKLRRELGEQVLALLKDPRTEDILLNPDSSLWIKRMGEGFTRAGEMPPMQPRARSARLRHGAAPFSITRTRFSKPNCRSTAAALKESSRPLFAALCLRSGCARERFSRSKTTKIRAS